MIYRLLLSKKVSKFIASRSGKERDLIKRKLDMLSQNPIDHPLLDIKLLKNKDKLYRLRINKYRFIYEIIDMQLIIFVYTAGSRGDIYKKK